jgi:HPt (histidine-containing phosphotransfer) domain-containing protein
LPAREADPVRTPDEKLAAALRELRAEYLEQSPQRLAELWSAFARVQNGDADGLARLQSFAHRLAGTGGSYGLPAVTDTARALDQACRALRETGNAPRPADVQQVRSLLQGVADAFAAATDSE